MSTIQLPQKYNLVSGKWIVENNDTNFYKGFSAIKIDSIITLCASEKLEVDKTIYPYKISLHLEGGKEHQLEFKAEEKKQYETFLTSLIELLKIKTTDFNFSFI